MRLATLLLPVVLGATSTAAGAGPELHGHAKLQASLHLFEDDDLGALVAGTRVKDLTLDLRLDAVWRHARWDLTVHPQLVAVEGDSARVANGPSTASGLAGVLLPGPVRTDDRGWLDLGHTFSGSGSQLVLAQLDRLSVGYTGNRFVARLGRQALSWGGGLVFQVFDLFNPFPPTVIDTDYKPGTDMLSTQWLLSGGDDLQAIVVPRRPAPGRPVTAEASSLALKWHHFAGGTELELLAAMHVDDAVAGAGASGNLGGGVWRINLTYTELSGGGATSAVANYARSWVWGQRNANGFVEVFRNGFGLSGLDHGVVTIPSPLLERLQRGELFTLGRNELAGGIQLEWTPRLKLEPTVLVNLDDASSMLLLRTSFDWRQNITLDAGLQVGAGPRGTEYGGVLVPGPAAYAGPGRLVWVRLARYF